MAGTDPRIGAEERLQKLRAQRVIERRNAIANGLMSDPDVPVPLSEAISLVGTCEDMCPEFERVTRIAQKDVSGPEMDPATRGGKFRDQVPDEKRMVKKFRRPAAGIEEQIPSDLRTPHCLTRSLNFLINDVIGTASSLESVHAFIWDRTRGVRNDFSVQQFKDLPRLKIWIRCLERVVRFHFLSRHQVGGRFPHVAPNYDHYQDGEQGFKSLFSLLKCYEDAASADSSYNPPNEPEFQSYKIMTLIPKNDIEAVKQLILALPERVRMHPYLQHAYNIYVAASTALNSDKVALPVAQNNIMSFWRIIESSETTYMLACTAEIFFQEIRKLALHTVLRTFGKSRGKPVTSDWSLNDLKTPLGFDTEEEAREYCEAHEVAIKQADNGSLRLERKGNEPLTLSRLQSFKSPAIQYFCGRLVESKREGRSLPDIINQPDIRGVAIEQDDEGESLFLPQNPNPQPGPPPGRRIAKARGARRMNLSAQAVNLSEGSGDESAGESSNNRFGAPSANKSTQANPFQNPFAKQNQTPTPSTQNPFATSKPAQTGFVQNPFGGAGFGQSSTGFAASPFGKPSGTQPTQSANPFGTPSAPSPFQSGQPAQTTNAFGKPSPSPFAPEQSASPFAQPSNPAAGTSPSNAAPFGQPPPAFQFPNLETQVSTAGVFSKPQPTSTSTATATPIFSFTGDGFGQTASGTNKSGQSVSFDFGTKQDGGASVPTSSGVQSAPSSFSFDFNFGGGTSSKASTSFNNPFASGQVNRTSFEFPKPQTPSQLQQQPTGIPVFQFGSSGAKPATPESQKPFASIPSGDLPKPSPFSFTANSTNANSIPAFSTSGPSFIAGGTSPFNFSAKTTGPEPTQKPPTGQMQLSSSSTPASESKATSTSASGTMPSAQATQVASFQFGPSIAQQRADQEKQQSSSSAATLGTTPSPSAPEKYTTSTIDEQSGAPSLSWTPAKEPPAPPVPEVPAIPPVVIKKTPKRERPPVNEFGLTEMQQKRYDDCMDYIVRELFLLPNQGILDQYIDWKMWPVFEEARRDREKILEQEHYEKIRKDMLLRKYCNMWKAKASLLRHRRQGRERRARLEKIRLEKLAKLEEENRRSIYTANAQHIMAQAEESLRRSQASRAKAQETSVLEPIVPSAPAVQTPLKRDLRHSILRRTPATEPSKQPSIDKRVQFSTVSKKAEKQSRTDHIYTPPRPLSGDPLRQSANDPLPAKLSTVKSDYFRLKAMGLKYLSPAYYKNTARWREKENTGSSSVLSMTSTSVSSRRTSISPPPLTLGNSLLLEDGPSGTESAKKTVRFDDEAVIAATSSVKGLRFYESEGQLPPLQRNPNNSVSGKRKYDPSLFESHNMQQETFSAAMDEDERRIARVKALTSRMAWQTDIFRDPNSDLWSLPPLSASLGENDSNNNGKEERPQKKVKLSLSSNDQKGIPLEEAKRKLPAYWFRDSKFVPRSEYGLGPKSKKLNTSSASASGSFSRTSQRGPDQASSRPTSNLSSAASISNQPRVNGVSTSSADDDIVVIDSSDDEGRTQNYENQARDRSVKVKQEMLAEAETRENMSNHDDEAEYEEDDGDEDGDEDNDKEEEEEVEENDEDYGEEDEDYEEDAEEDDDEVAGGTVDDPIVL